MTLEDYMNHDGDHPAFSRLWRSIDWSSPRPCPTEKAKLAVKQKDLTRELEAELATLERSIPISQWSNILSSFNRAQPSQLTDKIKSYLQESDIAYRMLTVVQEAGFPVPTELKRSITLLNRLAIGYAFAVYKDNLAAEYFLSKLLSAKDKVLPSSVQQVYDPLKKLVLDKPGKVNPVFEGFPGSYFQLHAEAKHKEDYEALPERMREMTAAVKRLVKLENPQLFTLAKLITLYLSNKPPLVQDDTATIETFGGTVTLKANHALEIYSKPFADLHSVLHLPECVRVIPRYGWKLVEQKKD